MDQVEYTIDESKTVPQLVRFAATKVSFERTRFDTPRIESRLKERFSIRLDLANPEQAEPLSKPNLRVVVEIQIEGHWREKDTEESVAFFSGGYLAFFDFDQDKNPDHIQKCLTSKWYRDLLVAQAYPLAKSHMSTELRLLGLNAPRKLGFDVYTGQFEPVDISSEAPSMPVSKPRKKPAGRVKPQGTS